MGLPGAAEEIERLEESLGESSEAALPLVYEERTGSPINTNPFVGHPPGNVYYAYALEKSTNKSIMGIVDEMIIDRQRQPHTIWINDHKQKT